MRLIVYRGAEVLDLSNFASKHPGGRKLLYSFHGKDISIEFDSAGHSQEAKRLADSFVIETIDSTDVRPSNSHDDGDLVTNVDSLESDACKYHSERRAQMLRKYPEIEELYGQDWIPLVYGLFCMAAFCAYVL